MYQKDRQTLGLSKGLQDRQQLRDRGIAAGHFSGPAVHPAALQQVHPAGRGRIIPWHRGSRQALPVPPGRRVRD